MLKELTRIEARLERIEEKMDNYLERQAVVETKIDAQAGKITFLMTGIVSVIGAGLTWLLNKLFGG